MSKLTDLTSKDFLTALASSAPAPGGGGGAAMAGALAAALASMVCNLTIGKEKFAAQECEVKALLQEAEQVRQDLLALVEDDAAVFNSFMACYKLPKTTDAEKAARTAAIRKAAKQAAEVPLAIAKASLRGFQPVTSIFGAVNSFSSSPLPIQINLASGTSSAILLKSCGCF